MLGRGGRRLAAELSERDLARAVERLTGRLEDFRRAELPGDKGQEWRAAGEALRDTLLAARPVDVSLVLDTNADPVRLAAYVRERGARELRSAGLGRAGRELYERLLLVACAQVVEMVRALPGFGADAQVATLREVRETRTEIAGLAGRLGVGEEDADRVFTVRYLDHVVRTRGTLEVFGLVRGRAPARYSFDTAYVDLAVARTVPDDEPDTDLTGAGTGVASAFADVPRVVLRGGAGAGKTTLLDWLATQAARGAVEAGATESCTVPLLLPLRRFPDGDLPAPEQLPAIVARVIADEMPKGWVSRHLTSGRAWLLVDGVDELAADKRGEVQRWVEEMVGEYPAARYVVTTRPSVVDDGWLAGSGFVRFDLLSMSATSTREFVKRWHDAARAACGPDDVARHWLDKCERGLVDVLGTRPELRRLASSPLLCGLLCALHQDGNMHLPRDRKGLYEEALDLLLVRWDEQRRVRPYQEPTLSREEQVVLLQRFAYSLIKNEDVQVPREVAVRRFTHAMKGLRSRDADPAVVLQHMLERTGMLREPQPDSVQFVHRTFRDYLAAKEVVDSGDMRHLAEHAHLDLWHDVVVMAVAHARPHERETLLHELLNDRPRSRQDPRTRDRLHLVAAACLEQADVTATNDVRDKVERAAARLIPPANLDDAELLARAGRFVLDLLPGPAGLPDAQAACVIRTAALLGGEAAWEKIAEFTNVDESVVIDELLRAWRQSDDPEDYARTVLAKVNFGDRRLDVRGWHRVRHLRHLTQLRHVRCLGDLTPLDPLTAIPQLLGLELTQNDVLRDLGPLARCRTLRELRLSHCLRVKDLSPLAASTVEKLALHFVPAELGTLRGAALRVLTLRDVRLRDGLDELPADLPLRELALDNLARDRNLAGVRRWATLESVAVNGVPGEAELAELAELPLLRRLVVHQPDIADLYRLRSLPALRQLDLDGVSDDQPGVVVAATPSWPGLEIRVNNRTFPPGSARPAV